MMHAPSARQGGTGSLAVEQAKQDALARLDLVAVVRAYVLGVVDAAQGYKGLLLDKETMRVASTLWGRTELAEHNVVNIERIDNEDPGRRPHKELKVSSRGRTEVNGRQIVR
jgi:hypothetical protein